MTVDAACAAHNTVRFISPPRNRSLARHYRSGEEFYIKPQKDAVTVVFPMIFKVGTISSSTLSLKATGFNL